MATASTCGPTRWHSTAEYVSISKQVELSKSNFQQDDSCTKRSHANYQSLVSSIFICFWFCVIFTLPRFVFLRGHPAYTHHFVFVFLHAHLCTFPSISLHRPLSLLESSFFRPFRKRPGRQHCWQLVHPHAKHHHLRPTPFQNPHQFQHIPLIDQRPDNPPG